MPVAGEIEVIHDWKDGPDGPDFYPSDMWSWAWVTYRYLPGMPGYCVGSDGSVWSRRGRHGRRLLSSHWTRLVVQVGSDGYPCVGLRVNGLRRIFRVHALVLTAFIGPRPDGYEGCHFPDRSPLNCNLWNLRWGTRESNIEDQITHGTRSRIPKKRRSDPAKTEARRQLCGSVYARKLDARRVTAMKSLLRAGEKQVDVAAQFEVSGNVVSLINSGRIWAHVP